MKRMLSVSGMFLCLLCSTLYGATYSGGSGTQEDPYRISTVADWQTLMGTSDDWGKRFILTADLNLAGVTLTPVGSSTVFTGAFDGGNHTIRNVVIDQPDSDGVGLFGRVHVQWEDTDWGGEEVEGSGRICNLRVEDVNITGQGTVGGLVGYNYGSEISNCYATGSVSSYATAGGLVGCNIGSEISNCYSTASVSAYGSDSSRSYAGGLVGYNGNGTISECYSTGSVSAYASTSFYSYAGGLVGFNSSGRISDCYSSSSVSSSSSSRSYAGGLVASNESGTISNCYSTGSVSSSSSSPDSYSYAGGLVGYNNWSCRISNSYSSSSVYSSAFYAYAGGLVGEQDMDYHYYYSTTILNCFSVGLVSASGDNTYAGGLVGVNYLSYGISNCFWDTQTSGLNIGVGSGSSTGGKTTAEMKMLSTFAAAGWDIADINGDAAWFMSEDGQNYPIIAHFIYNFTEAIPVAGDGTEQNPYQIKSAEDFVALGEYCSAWNKHIILMANLDLSGFTLRPIGNSMAQFIGNFNGQGFVIHNAAMNLPDKDNVGLFGCVGKNGAISNLGIEDVNISGPRVVGGLAGYNKGTISNCYSTGRVAGKSSSYIGGLVGLSYGGTISKCHSTVNVSGAGSTIGGLVGANAYDNTISSCYASGTITNIDPNSFGSFAGGLVGSNAGTISKCSASNNVLATSASSLSCMSIGGLAGFNSGLISNSYTAGDISVTSVSPLTAVSGGGLVGMNLSGDVNDCYATGRVTFSSTESSNFIGGLIGVNEGSVNCCYSKGLIGSSESAEADSCVGGVAGINMNGVVLGSFWDIQASGKTVSGGGKGLTTEQMQTMLIYQNAGWANRGWVINEGADCPRLDWENAGGVPIPVPGPVPLLGSGTEADPYQVRTAADFALLSWHISVLDKHIVLMADIDLAEIGIYQIGDRGRPFTGTFDGNGHVIRNILIHQPTNSYVGLFGSVGAGGVITDLGIEDVNIVGGDFVGGLIGKNEGGIVRGCHSTGNIDGFSYIGGLIGSNEGGTVENCYSAGIVTAWDSDDIDACTGGLVGRNSSGTISKCYSNSAITGCGNVGGLVGYNYSSTITACYATGNVTSVSHYAGGLMGYNYCGTIKNCYATGNVTSSSDYVGGLAGRNEGSSSWSPSRIENCYAVGNVTSSYPFLDYYYYYPISIGGLVGSKGNWSIIGGCFWDTQTSGFATSAGGTGKTTVQMKTRDTYDGWNFVRLWLGNDGSYIWYMRSGDYPRLIWQNHSPAANAGADQTVYVRTTDAKAEVILNGSGSSDADGDALRYKWSWEVGGAVYEANGVNLAIELPIGPHKITLVINDGLVDSAPDEVNIVVKMPPVAEAGHEQTVYEWIYGTGRVVLDGSNSNDPYCDSLTYKWTWAIDGKTYEANGVSPVVELPAGVHRITLVVNDGLADSAPDDVNVTVIASVKAVIKITPQTINRKSSQPQIQAVIQLPAGITSADVVNEPLAIYPSGIKVMKQTFSAGGTGICASFDKDALMAAITDGDIKFIVAGKLKSGQWFYGCNTVKVIGQETKK